MPISVKDVQEWITEYQQEQNRWLEAEVNRLILIIDREACLELKRTIACNEVIVNRCFNVRLYGSSRYGYGDGSPIF